MLTQALPASALKLAQDHAPLMEGDNAYPSLLKYFTYRYKDRSPYFQLDWVSYRFGIYAQVVGDLDPAYASANSKQAHTLASTLTSEQAFIRYTEQVREWSGLAQVSYFNIYNPKYVNAYLHGTQPT